MVQSLGFSPGRNYISVAIRLKWFRLLVGGIANSLLPVDLVQELAVPVKQYLDPILMGIDFKLLRLCHSVTIGDRGGEIRWLSGSKKYSFK